VQPAESLALLMSTCTPTDRTAALVHHLRVCCSVTIMPKDIQLARRIRGERA
jgi:hypothetical protein